MEFMKFIKTHVLPKEFILYHPPIQNIVDMRKVPTCPVGVYVLLQEVNGSQTDDKTLSKPERDNWAIFLMEVDQKLMQAATSYDVGEIPISGMEEG